MPKMKTHKSSAKRFKVSGSGKIIRSKAYKSHILTKKTAKRKRNLRKDTTVSSAEVKKVRVLLPYS
ncbi:MAG: 50S ribosomal protein L35 [Atribacterota bacterium]|nr:50S ribosomal protein L35 [Atribacterota bacterium]